jgi:hypothetical protein
MTPISKYKTRRKPGAEEGTPAIPPPASGSETPMGRRKQLLRWLRSRTDLKSSTVRILEAQLDRIPVSSPNLVTWDSIETMARRAGVSERSVMVAHAELARLGLQIRLSPCQFEDWLEAIGTDLGFRYPSEARRPARFSIMLFHLNEDAAERARIALGARRICALKPPAERAESALDERRNCAPGSAETALRSPYREFVSVESGSLNVRGDGSLDPGVQKTEPSSTPILDPDELAGLRSLAAGDNPFVSRMALARLRDLGDVAATSPLVTPAPLEPIPAPVPVEPATPAIPVTTLAELASGPDLLALAASLSMATESPTDSTRSQDVAQVVRDLPGAPAFKVASAARALQRRFRDEGNPITETTYRRYLDLVRIHSFPVDLVVGLVKDACSPGVKQPANQLSKALKDEWNRVKNRPPVSPGKLTGDRL